MKILITGGLGFIGSNLATELSKRNHDIILLDNLDPRYGGNRFNIFDSKSKNINVVEDSVLNNKLLKELVKDTDLVIHTAAQVSYIDSFKIIRKEIDLNIKATINILEAIKANGCKAKLVFTSSRMVYGKLTKKIIHESNDKNPVSIYGITKLTSENLIKSYANEYNIKFLIIRITNPYGIKQQIKHSKYSIVGWFIRCAMEDKEIHIYGDGQQKRNYIFSKDLIDCIVSLINNKASNNQILNLGSDYNVSFSTMVQTVIKVVGSGRVKYVEWPEDYEKIETSSFNVSIDLLKNILGKIQFTSLEEGIRKSKEYYKKYWDNYV